MVQTSALAPGFDKATWQFLKIYRRHKPITTRKYDCHICIYIYIYISDKVYIDMGVGSWDGSMHKGKGEGANINVMY